MTTTIPTPPISFIPFLLAPNAAPSPGAEPAAPAAQGPLLPRNPPPPAPLPEPTVQEVAPVAPTATATAMESVDVDPGRKPGGRLSTPPP